MSVEHPLPITCPSGKASRGQAALHSHVQVHIFGAVSLSMKENMGRKKLGAAWAMEEVSQYNSLLSESSS